MPEYAMILIRALLSFIVLLGMTRLMGKTQLSQLTFFDYIVGISIGSIAGSISIDQNVKLINGVIGILVWGLLPVLISLADLKSYRLRRFMDGSPTVLIQGGRVLEYNLNKTRLTADELMMMLRQNNVFHLEEAEYAVLETNGKLSVMRKSDAEPLTARTLGIRQQLRHDPRIVVMDGTVMERTLRMMGRDRNWLMGELHKQGAKSERDVFLAQLASDGALYVDLRE